MNVMAHAAAAVAAAQLLFARPSAAWHTGLVLRDAWDRHAGEWISWARAPGHDSDWRFHRDAFLQLVPPPGRLTLDMRCGEGRHQLREYFPAALEAFDELAAPDALELLGKAPDPARAAKLTRAQVSAALKRARRHHIADKTSAILAALRGEQLAQAAAITTAYAVTVRSLAAVIVSVSEQVKILEEQAGAHFGQHPQPGSARWTGRHLPRAARPGARRNRRNLRRTSWCRRTRPASWR